jgi:hypothetical protein
MVFVDGAGLCAVPDFIESNFALETPIRAMVRSSLNDRAFPAVRVE